MSLVGRLQRRRLGLAPPRSRVLASELVVPAEDGTRLAARLLRPEDPTQRRGTVLIRSERSLEAAGPLGLLAGWLAEDGRTVVFQSCRGRGRSEGELQPFACEQSDGGAAIRWLLGEPWFDGPLALLGLGYSAFTAWAALAAEPAAVTALVAGFGARDPYAWLWPHGVLHLEAALALAARLDGREGRDASQLDLARAGRFLPVGESDRVAWREQDAFREWLRHPDPDGYWSERTPPLPERPPATLQLAGWYEPALAAELADYRVLAGRAAAQGSAPPGLWIGPWGAAAPARGPRARDAQPLSCLARATLGFLARAAGDRAPRNAPVRVYAQGAGWRESSRWPPERVETHTLHLHSGGAANTRHGDGRLEAEPPRGEEPADAFAADPADPVPSLGGVTIGSASGPLDQAPVEERGDVLCFTGPPLPRPLEIAGAVRAVLYAASSAESGDLVVRLARVDAGGTSRWLCEGVARVGPAQIGAPARVEVELGSAAARLAPGERLRLQIAASSVPRFARSPHTGKSRSDFRAGEGRVAWRRLLHDARHPSSLRLEVLAKRASAGGAPENGGGSGDEGGPAPAPAAPAEGPAPMPSGSTAGRPGGI